MNNIVETIISSLADALSSIIAFIPDLIAGIVILLVGWIVAAVLRAGVRKLLEVINIRGWLSRAGVDKSSQQETWITILAQLVFWTVLIFFLIPAFEAWNVPGVTNVINQLILYLPQVIAAVVIGLLGFIFANLLGDIVRNTSRSMGENVSSILSGIARYSILVFTGLIVLQELGIAPALIQILLSGLMVAFALAVGLAFGLGGRDAASRMLDKLEQSAQQASKKIKK
ncbi:MAG: mechanosensitive ion channel family protein [Patescibacteria group bacterium]|jgi:hypothetical protein